MANIASQKKRIDRTERERLENRRLTGAVGTHFRRLEKAIANVLDQGIRTGDIMAEGCRQVGTVEMGDAILAEFKALSA